MSSYISSGMTYRSMGPTAFQNEKMIVKNLKSSFNKQLKNLATDNEAALTLSAKFTLLINSGFLDITTVANTIGLLAIGKLLINPKVHPRYEIALLKETYKEFSPWRAMIQSFLNPISDNCPTFKNSSEALEASSIFISPRSIDENMAAVHFFFKNDLAYHFFFAHLVSARVFATNTLDYELVKRYIDTIFKQEIFKDFLIKHELVDKKVELLSNALKNRLINTYLDICLDKILWAKTNPENTDNVRKFMADFLKDASIFSIKSKVDVCEMSEILEKINTIKKF